MRGNIKAITKAWAAFTEKNLSPEERSLADSFAKARKTYVHEDLVPAANAMLTADAITALQIYTAKIDPVGPHVLESVGKLIQYQLDKAKKEYDADLARYQAIRGFSIASMVIGVLLALGLE